MKKTILVIIYAIAIGSISCNEIKKELEQDEVKGKTINSISHPMYNGRVTLEMDPKYERFNLEELTAVAKAQPDSSFINQIFDYKRLDLLNRMKKQIYVYIDTSTYEEIIQFERMAKRSDITPDRASVIGGMFMESLREAVGNPDAEVDITEAKYGTQKFFKFGYYKMNVLMNGRKIHSSQFIITSRASTYSMYSLGPADVDHYNLQNKIKFNE